jgi:acyl-CoA dehydrogenase
MVATLSPTELNDEQLMLRDMARDFARKEIAPNAEHYDRANEFPWPIIKKASEIGLTTLNIPEEYGGGGASVFEECLVGTELAWGCSGMSTAITINNLSSLPISLGGSEDQKKYWLGERMVDQSQMAAYCVTEPGAGSNVVGMRTRAEKKGDKYVLNGTKTFISNATVAHFYTVFAVTDPDSGHRGISCFIVERDSPGLSVSSHFDKMGQRASDTAEVSFENVEVPADNMLGKEGEGFYLAMRVFDKSRVPVAAGAVGVAQRALDESVRYSQERETFGVPIWQHQAVGQIIAQMATQVEAARSLTHRAARAVDNDDPDLTKLASMAKAFASDIAMQATVDAVQVFGGYGFMKEYPVEKLMRDVKVYQIYEGTSQIQRNIIMRELVKGGN